MSAVPKEVYILRKLLDVKIYLSISIWPILRTFIKKVFNFRISLIFRENLIIITKKFYFVVLILRMKTFRLLL
jgi:hypothetical protein